MARQKASLKRSASYEHLNRGIDSEAEQRTHSSFSGRNMRVIQPLAFDDSGKCGEPRLQSRV